MQVNRSTQCSPNRFVRPDYEALLDVSNVPLDEYASKSVVESDCPFGVECIRRSALRVGRDVEQRDRARHLVVFTRQFQSQASVAPEMFARPCSCSDSRHVLSRSSVAFGSYTKPGLPLARQVSFRL